MPILYDIYLKGLLGVLLLANYARGRNQHLSASVVESKIRIGMTLSEVESSLALKAGTLISSMEPMTPPDSLTYEQWKFRWFVRVSNHGLGAWFTPQHDIAIYLDRDKKVYSGHIYIVYGPEGEGKALKLVAGES